MKKTYVPSTPAGTLLFHLESKTRKEAIKKVMREAAHMPYKTWADFEKRGYVIEEMEDEI